MLDFPFILLFVFFFLSSKNIVIIICQMINDSAFTFTKLNFAWFTVLCLKEVVDIFCFEVNSCNDHFYSNWNTMQ